MQENLFKMLKEVEDNLKSRYPLNDNTYVYYLHEKGYIYIAYQKSTIIKKIEKMMKKYYKDYQVGFFQINEGTLIH